MRAINPIKRRDNPVVKNADLDLINNTPILRKTNPYLRKNNYNLIQALFLFLEKRKVPGL